MLNIPWQYCQDNLEGLRKVVIFLEGGLQVVVSRQEDLDTFDPQVAADLIDHLRIQRVCHGDIHRLAGLLDGQATTGNRQAAGQAIDDEWVDSKLFQAQVRNPYLKRQD